MNQESELLKQVSKWAWKAGETQARLDRAKDLLQRSLNMCGCQKQSDCSYCCDVLGFLNYLKEQENDS